MSTNTQVVCDFCTRTDKYNFVEKIDPKTMPDDCFFQSAINTDRHICEHCVLVASNALKARDNYRNEKARKDELELQSMMRDPKYWRDQDPSFVAKVTEGFQKLYGKK